MTDEFSKLFSEADAARSGTRSFVYRHPITGDISEGVGEAPLNWGEYPEGIDPDSPEADQYDLNRGLFRPLPDALFTPGGMEDIKEMPEGSQIDDPYWATASRILHDYLSPGRMGRNRVRGVDYEMTPEEYARYGVRFISSFDNNITAMAVNTAQLANAPMPVHKAMYYLLETGDREGILASNFGRAALNMAADPFNWVGLATFGIGTAGKMAGQKLTKMAFKDVLKNMVIGRPTAASAALGAEGAFYGAADNLARQNVAVEAGVQTSIDPVETATAAATTGVLGERLGAGGAAAIEAGRRGIVKLGEGAERRMAEGGTTLTSGVDPDPIIAALGKRAATNENLIDATGDVVVGDVVIFKQDVFGGSFRNPRHIGERIIKGEVVRDSYGKDKQQHTFTIKPIEVTGVSAEEIMKKDTFRIKGRNLYKHGTLREKRADESSRQAALDEKHKRGDAARAARNVRKNQM